MRLDIEPGSGRAFRRGRDEHGGAAAEAGTPPAESSWAIRLAMTAHVALFERLEPVRLRGKSQATQPWLVTGGSRADGVELRRVSLDALR